ncbi:hypothetical protein JS533_012840 [Bifidobacterium amazonense]|uniref:SpaA-like prealbumin fold domain-containing protein n=1 Tax=Bifidobacterium amazonense TaxID=2809027 RepID=A0ABS9VYZ6_9BIFI|nr:SpaA isopeptide-forming pilin-related protein [Bifidobacterium amazonense]MCH9277136.1 hypothetical protein [Bifidobacterium amazonense]
MAVLPVVRGDGQIDATNISTKDDCAGKGYYQNGFGDQGLALKAVVTNAAEKDNAQSTGQILISGNGARLSGGGFGSNGVVVFDSPYSMSWNKADANTKDPVTSSSTWKITTTDDKLDARDDGEEKSPYMAPSMRPAQCQAGGTLPKTCWQKDEDDKTWSVTVTDNDPTRDNDNTIGSISIDNLAPGTYTLQETIPPVGYELNPTEYTFTIKAAGTDNKVPEQPTLTVPTNGNALVDGGRTIGDQPVTGALTWKKIDSTSNQPIGGSVWKITDNNGQTVDGYDTITDNTGKNGYQGKDEEPIAGVFKVTLDATGTKGLKEGSYKLVETQAPDGYWMPSTVEYAFTVVNENDAMTATWTDANMKGVIANTVRSVSWTKTDADTGQAIGGAEWKLVRTKNADNKDIAADQQPAWTVLDCGSNANGCSGKSNAQRPTDASENRWADADADPGKFRLEKLEPGSYELTETRAPAGYVMRKATYKFTITANQPAEAVTLQHNGTTVTDNKVGNSRAISFLPSTGGPTPRGWLTMGVLLLGGSLTITWWAKRREAR